MDQEEEVENKHLSIKKTHGESVLTVKNQPIESLESHKTSHLEDSYQFRIQDSCSPTIPESDLDQGSNDINFNMAMTATIANKLDRASRTMDDMLI